MSDLGVAEDGPAPVDNERCFLAFLLRVYMSQNLFTLLLAGLLVYMVRRCRKGWFSLTNGSQTTAK